ncbi:MarR family transcriptional regulator [Nocardiopsis sp. HNM0947]|uniref:MarR family transcriptional regulator n=1 Tax=Nocardiopsis coralli TaxID=2772213 RepID=A0ABR9PAH8_9ACTN|nr:MarR family transcriptional regulator [Nocardiopsis coralli]MBE3000850.1 MarR family transcriptional regulator [Nocardiopsis coralli]
MDGAPEQDGRDEVDEIIGQWRDQRPDLPAGVLGVFGRIARLNAAQREILKGVHDRHELALGSFDALANLRRSGLPHRKTAGELAASSLLTSGGITFRLDRMEADGLVRRVRSEEDRRVVHAELTPLGLERIDRAFTDHLLTEEEMLAGLTPEEVDLLAALLRKLGRSLAEHRAAPPAAGVPAARTSPA